jgi:uncharacterized membrane protein YkvA (DUF1232 family)
MSVFKQLFRFWKVTRRVGGARAVFDFARHAPQYFVLMVRLLKDPRVSPFPKAVFLGTGIFAISPLNIPEWVPVVGALDDIGLAIFAITFFLGRIPTGIMSEHREALGLKALEERL